MEKIKIGKIVSVIGLKGEVKVYNFSDSQTRYKDLDSIYVNDTKMYIENVRFQKSMVILKFKGIDNRNEAELLRNRDLFITENDLPELESDTYFVRDLIGLDVISDEGDEIGIVTDIIQNTAQDIYRIVTKDDKEVLIPSVKEFIKSVDIDKGQVVVHLIEGMM